MNLFIPIRLTGLLLVGAALWATSSSVYAAGTASGTPVSNTATLSYNVGTVAQTPVDSNEATFLVDNRVDHTVTNEGGATVAPGSSDQVLPFTLINTGNTTQGYRLTVVAGVGAEDDFDMTSVRIYVDVNGDGLFDGGDTLYADGTSVGDLNPNSGVAADATIQLLIVSNTPATVTDNQTALYHLVATATNAGTATITAQDSGVDDPDVVQVVFGDAVGSESADALGNGQHSASSVYNVQAAAITVVKTSQVISDPLNNTTNPKTIPGAVVEYTIEVTNAGTTAASSAVIVDEIPVNATFVSGSVSATNSNGTVTPLIEYSTNNTLYSPTETTPVAFIRATHSLVDGANGAATLVFRVTID